MSNTGHNVKIEGLRQVGFGSITTSYAALGSALTHTALRVTIYNNTDACAYYNIDGVTDQYKMPPFSGKVLDDKTNDLFRNIGTQFYVKYNVDVTLGDAQPTKGSFWIEVEYA